MTRQEFERAKKIKAELEVIEQSLSRPKSTYVIAFYKDYSTGVGVPRTEEGEDGGRNVRIMLESKYERRKEELQRTVKKISSAIEKVEDSEMRTILEGFYIANMTQEEIAEKLNMHQTTVSRKLAQYFENIETTEEVNTFIRMLKKNKGLLSRQEFKTLKGRALAGDVSGAKRGYITLLQRKKSTEA